MAIKTKIRTAQLVVIGIGLCAIAYFTTYDLSESISKVPPPPPPSTKASGQVEYAAAYREDAKTGSQTAIIKLACFLYQSGRQSKDSEARELLQKLADTGDMEAKVYLAKYLLIGLGGEKDKAQADALLKEVHEAFKKDRYIWVADLAVMNWYRLYVSPKPVTHHDLSAELYFSQWIRDENCGGNISKHFIETGLSPWFIDRDPITSPLPYPKVDTPRPSPHPPLKPTLKRIRLGAGAGPDGTIRERHR